MKRSFSTLILAFGAAASLWLNACVTIKTVGESSTQGNNLNYIYQPTYTTKDEFFGSEYGRLLTGLFLGGGAAAYGYFAAPTSYKIGRETITTTPTGNAVVLGLAASAAVYYTMKLFTPPLGNRIIEKGEEYRWLKEFNQTLRYAGSDYASKGSVTSLYYLAPQQETTYQLRTFRDLQYFETAFPNSSRLQSFITEGLPFLGDADIEEIGKRFSFFNHNEAIHQKIREVAFSRVNSLAGCQTLLQKYPMAKDLAEARAAFIAKELHRIDAYEEFFRRFPNGNHRAEVLAKAHEIMQVDLASCLLPEQYEGFFTRWEPPKLGDAKTLAEAKKRYAKAQEEQKKYYGDIAKFDVGSVLRTGIYVKQGSRVQISATGIVRVGPWAGTCDARGLANDFLTKYNIDKRFNHGALLCNVGNSDWFPIGLVKQFTASSDGVINLFVNDADYCNNEGSFAVKIASDTLGKGIFSQEVAFYPGDSECERRAAEAQARFQQYRKEQEEQKVAEEHDKAARQKIEEETEANQRHADNITGAKITYKGEDVHTLLGMAMDKVSLYDVDFPNGTSGKIYQKKDTKDWCIDAKMEYFCDESQAKVIAELYRRKN